MVQNVYVGRVQRRGCKEEAVAVPKEPVKSPVGLSAASTLAGTEIPLYPNAFLKNKNEKGDWSTHIYTTPDTVDEVLTFYKSEMPRRGWELASETGGVTAGLEYVKLDVAAPITISSLELTTISLMIGPKASAEATRRT